MIRSISIEHFKSVERVDFDLTPVTVLVGPNGCGKSNLLDAIRFLKDAVSFDVDRAVSDRHGIDSIRQWSRYKPYHVTISVTIDSANGNGRFSLTLSSVKGNYKIVKEEGVWQYTEREIVGVEDADKKGRVTVTEQMVHRHVSYERHPDGKVSITDYRDGKYDVAQTEVEAKDSLFLDEALSGTARTRRRYGGLFSLRREISNFEAYSIYPNTLRTPQTPSNDTRLSPTGSNLTSVFRLMTRSKGGTDARAEIVDSLRSIMPQLETITIQSIGGLMVPIFRVHEDDNRTHTFNVSQISDGTLRVFGILTALYQLNKPAVIGLEEPEQTINPGILALIADAIKEVSATSQVIITTHSPNFIDQFDPEQVRAIEMKKGITRAGRVNRAQFEAVKSRLFTLGELMTVEGLSP